MTDLPLTACLHFEWLENGHLRVRLLEAGGFDISGDPSLVTAALKSYVKAYRSRPEMREQPAMVLA